MYRRYLPSQSPPHPPSACTYLLPSARSSTNCPGNEINSAVYYGTITRSRVYRDLRIFVAVTKIGHATGRAVRYSNVLSDYTAACVYRLRGRALLFRVAISILYIYRRHGNWKCSGFSLVTTFKRRANTAVT